MTRSPWKSRLYIAAGFVSIGVGVVGIWTPLLPTTEFMLLAAFCFARGSERWHAWLMSHPTFSPYIRAFQEKRGLTRPQKWRIGLLTTLSLSLTAIFIPSWYGKVTAGLLWLAIVGWLAFSRTAEDASANS